MMLCRVGGPVRRTWVWSIAQATASRRSATERRALFGLFFLKASYLFGRASNQLGCVGS